MQKLSYVAEFYAQPNSAVMIQLFLPRARTWLQVNSSRWASAGAKPFAPFWMAFLVFLAI